MSLPSEAFRKAWRGDCTAPGLAPDDPLMRLRWDAPGVPYKAWFFSMLEHRCWPAERRDADRARLEADKVKAAAPKKAGRR